MHVTKQLHIAYTYHFISEAIIIYLAILPIMYKYYEVSVWFYLAIVFSVSLVYSIISKRTTNYLPYLLFIPVSMMLFHFVGYTISLCIAFASLFAWRFIAIRGKPYAENEANYIGATFLLTLVDLFILRDFELLILMFVQLLVVLIGYAISNIIVIEQEKKRSINRTEWFKWGGFFLVVSVTIFLLKDILTKVVATIWGGIGDVLTLMAGVVARFMEFLGISDFFLSGIEQMEPPEMTGIPKNEPMEPKHLTPSDGLGTETVVIIGIAIISLVFIFVLYKSMKTKAVHDKQNHDNQYELMVEKIEPEPFYKKIFLKRSVKPNHPIRKLVYDFEKKTSKLNLGRMHYESIENWFNRIGLQGNIEIYQKVRYGEKTTTPEEEETLRAILKSFEKQLKEQDKKRE